LVRLRRVIALAVAVISAAGLAQPAPTLHYAASLVQAQIMAGEGVVLRVSLRNDGATPITVVWGRDGHPALYQFAVEHSDGTSLLPAESDPLPAIAALASGDFRQIEPGGTAEEPIAFYQGHMEVCHRYAFRRSGTYRIEASFHAVVVTPGPAGPGGVPTYRSAWEGVLVAEPVVLTVAEPADAHHLPAFGNVMIAGEVVDPAGKPISGARVEVEARIAIGGWPPNSADHSETIDVQVTDAQGRFAATRLPGDSPRFELRCTHPRFVRAATSLANAPPRKEYTARLVMDPGTVLRGTVVQEDGSPLAGARLTAGEKVAFSDAEGRFELVGVPGQGSVGCQASKGGYATQSVEVADAQSKPGDLKVVLKAAEPKAAEALTFAGQAVFTDGKPVADASILLYLKTWDGMLRVPTGPDGRFTGTLPRPGTFAGRAWVVEGGTERTGKSPAAARRWYAAVGPFSPGACDLEWVFDNRGRIRISVEPAARPPQADGFKLTCRFWPPSGLPPHESDHLIAEVAVPTEGGVTTLDSLAPGMYEVRLAEPKGWWLECWSKRLTLPGEDGGTEATVVIAPYGKDYGGFRGRLTMPGGAALPKDIRASVRLPDQTSRLVEVRDGIVSAGKLPVGSVCLTVWPPGCHTLTRDVEIQPGAITDLGDLRLVTPGETHGTVIGHVLFEDGTPALGAVVGERLGPRSGVRVGADGSFRFQLPAGTRTAEVGLWGIPLWPRAALPGELNFSAEGAVWNLAREWNDTVRLPLEMAVGETLSREVVIDRSALGNVRVKWLGPTGMSFRLALTVVRDGGVFTCHTPTVGVGRVYDRPEGILIEKVPRGERFVSLSVWQGKVTERGLDYCGYQRQPAGDAESLFAFDPAAGGSLSGTLRRPNGEPVPSESVVLWPEPLESVRGLGPGGQAVVRPDGTFRFPSVAPGRYLVRLGPPGERQDPLVEVRQGEEAKVELVVP
jgi:protocatechuate 3,4-dioxygenase beta subunit